MLPAVGAKSAETAVDGAPCVSATDWSVAVPVQSPVAYRWKTTVPVGFATDAGVPDARCTNTLSWTIVPATTDVTTPPVALRMSVRAVASSQFFAASALSPAFASPVARCNVRPPTPTSVVARTTVVPVAADVICTVQDPVVPTVAQLFTPPTKLPGPLRIENPIAVPAGALANAEPALTFTWPVRVWFVPTGLFADAGVTWMFASTHVFTAGPLPFGPVPMLAVAGSVSRVSATPRTVSAAVAFAVVVPPVGLLMISVHRPLAFVPDSHVPPLTVAVAPLALVIPVVTAAPWAATKPFPSPAFTLTLTVNVWLAFTSFVA